ncbi:acetaldehyde dehydrogenase (acetylating) [Vagococcus sp.]|uniref:acetaldehyde dehydrogenase (acetylating) n=1 Tax=Vagococcus sp. TaxID=1933889 RepID=UPI003F9C449D
MKKLDKDLLAIQEARDLVNAAKIAQKELATFSQEKIDHIVKNIAEVSTQYAEILAKMAVEETKFGNYEDKIIKNKFASETVYHSIKDMKTVGIIKEDKQNKSLDIGVPLGVIAAITPSTNPTSTIIYKTLIALKAGNGIVFSPHPNAVKCSLEAIEIVSKAAIDAGAPKGIVSCLNQATLVGTQELMSHEATSLILATGGGAMVKAAYSSGTPTISGGPGNTPAYIEKTANVEQAVKDIFKSKTFDNGVICASEQSIIVEASIEQEVIAEVRRNHGYFLNADETEMIGKFLLRANGTINPVVVGKSAVEVAKLAGILVPAETKILISKQTEISRSNPFSREKLCPILAFYCVNSWEEACKVCHSLLENEGRGHTLVIHSNDEVIIRSFILEKEVSRVLVNTPAALGGIGATTNISPALTLGCGAIGGGSISDNVSPLNLINVRKAAYGIKELNFESNPQSEQAQDLRFVEEKEVEIERDTRFDAIADLILDSQVNENKDTRFTEKTTENTLETEQVEKLLAEVMKNLVG